MSIFHSSKKSSSTIKLITLMLGLLLCVQGSQAFAASPWVEHETYLGKVGGKFSHGLKHSLFSVALPWLEANKKEYSHEWLGFCIGIGYFITSTASGVIQLATFPIPVDFPPLEDQFVLPPPDKVKPFEPGSSTDWL